MFVMPPLSSITSVRLTNEFTTRHTSHAYLYGICMSVDSTTLPCFHSNLGMNYTVCSSIMWMRESLLTTSEL